MRERMPSRPSVSPPAPVKGDSSSGLTARRAATDASGPPWRATTASGTVTRAAAMRRPWARSVQDTARNPPIRV